MLVRGPTKEEAGVTKGGAASEFESPGPGGMVAMSPVWSDGWRRGSFGLQIARMVADVSQDGQAKGWGECCCLALHSVGMTRTLSQNGQRLSWHWVMVPPRESGALLTVLVLVVTWSDETKARAGLALVGEAMGMATSSCAPETELEE